MPDHYFKEKPVFDFEAKNHVDLCESLGLIDYQRGAKIAGNGAWVYRGAGALPGIGAAQLFCQRGI